MTRRGAESGSGDGGTGGSGDFEKNVRVILQSRVGSTRTPGKALADLGGRTLTEQVMFRAEAAFGRPGILAIPDSPENDPLEALARRRKWDVFRGSEEDVLGRFAGAVERFGPKVVVRVTGDNPFLAPEAMRGVAAGVVEGADAAQARGWPYGTGSEAVRAELLIQAAREARDPYEREHVMPFFYRRPDRFRLSYFDCPYPGAGKIRLTVDTPSDLDRARRLFARFGASVSIQILIRELSIL